MQELIYFSTFLYHYTDSAVSLEVARRETIVSHNPLNPSLVYVYREAAWIRYYWIFSVQLLSNL